METETKRLARRWRHWGQLKGQTMNALGKELTGKTVTVKGDSKTRYVCKDGFGCHTFTMGQAIFAERLPDHKEVRIEGADIAAIVEAQARPSGRERKG